MADTFNTTIRCVCTICGQYIELKNSEFIETSRSDEYIYGQKLECPHCKHKEFICRPNDGTIPQPLNIPQPPNIPLEVENPLLSRYKDSYLVARTITAFGDIVKFIAFFIGGSVIFVSICVSGQSPQYFLGGIMLAAVIGIPIYVLGVLVTAQGQILKATLDTAVNSSPLLTKDQMKQIMSLG